MEKSKLTENVASDMQLSAFEFRNYQTKLESSQQRMVERVVNRSRLGGGFNYLDCFYSENWEIFFSDWLQPPSRREMNVHFFWEHFGGEHFNQKKT